MIFSVRNLAVLVVTGLMAGCSSRPPHVANEHGEVFPAVAFDAAAAQAMLQPGRCTLSGRALAYENDPSPLVIINLGASHDAPPGTVVRLYPRTAYFDDWVALRTDIGGAARLSHEAHALRREAICDADGRFVFENLGPGSYFVEAVVHFVQKTAEDVQTGTVQTVYQQSNPHFTSQYVVETPTYTTVHGSYNTWKWARGTIDIEVDDAKESLKISN